MKYIYTGEQKKKGRKRRTLGKIIWENTEAIEKNFVFEGLTLEGDKMYSSVVWSVQWKKNESHLSPKSPTQKLLFNQQL